MITIKLKKGKTKRVKEGHLWIYRGELSEKIPKGIPAGPVVVEDHTGRFICIGDYSPQSNIAVRVLTWKKLLDADKDFFKRRIQSAYEYRKRVCPDESSYRLVFSEGDFLPGLIIDKYEDYLSVQPLTSAMDSRKGQIYEILNDLLSPKGIVERSDSPFRKNEGLDIFTKTVYGSIPERILIKDGGLAFYADLLKGEKTGYFFDQRKNRRALRLFSKGSDVLDVFTFTGGFAIHTAYYGAGHVTAVDISKDAVEIAIENSKINGFSNRMNFIVDNAFDYLKKASSNGEKYDLIILDPPAFTKSKDSRKAAYRGYKEINLRALKMLNTGGLLLSCSCSYNFSQIEFINMIKDAAVDVKKAIKVVEISGQSLDHPIYLNVPETNYLKAVFAIVME